jgi:hypothetical protein
MARQWGQQACHNHSGKRRMREARDGPARPRGGRARAR